VDVWPVSVGHGCIGCTEPAFWDTMTPFYERLPQVKIPGLGGVTDIDRAGKTILGVAAAAVGIHAAVGIGKKMIKGCGCKDEKK
jgi:hydrogenase small subunit/[NiFe] hydrogenase small subunit